MAVSPTSTTERVERWVAPALWALSVVLTLLVQEVNRGTTAEIAAVVAVTALTVAVSVRRLPMTTGERPRPWAVGWFVVHSAAVWAACVVAPLFGFLAWSGYVLLTRVFPVRLVGVGVVLTAAAASVSQIGGDLTGGAGKVGIYLGLVAINSAVAGTALYFAYAQERQSDERKAALELAERTLAENAALQEQLVLGAREAGVADERGRLAREIHDTIAQGLAGIVRQLEAAESAPPAEARRHTAAATRLARESLAEARRSVQDLRPEQLEAARLPDALATVAEDWSRLHGVTAGVRTTGDAQRLHPEVDVVLLRVAQEALTNVGRHAGARRVGVTLSYMGDAVTLDVRDDGGGFDPVAVDGGGYGLQSMRERVQAVGGRLAVESAPGEGTAVSAIVPAVEPR